MAHDTSLFMEQKTVLIVRPNDNIGGSQRMAKTYYNGLSEGGCKVIMITLCGKTADVKSNNSMIYLNKSRSLFSLLELRRVINVVQPDVVLGFQFQANMVLALLVLLNRRKNWQYFLRESNLQNYINSRPSHALAVKFTYLLADKIIAQCMDMKNHIIRHYGIAENKIQVIYNFPQNKDIILSSRRNVLIVASTLSEQKNIVGALNLWALQDCQHELHIYGHHGLRRKLLEDYVKRNSISNVRFKGLVSRIPYESYKLLLITSFYEGFSNAVLEALSCGTPVLAKKHEGGITEVVNNTNGVIYTDENSVDIALLFDRDWDYSAIRQNTLTVYNKSKFISNWEQLF